MGQGAQTTRRLATGWTAWVRYRVAENSFVSSLVLDSTQRPVNWVPAFLGVKTASVGQVILIIPYTVTVNMWTLASLVGLRGLSWGYLYLLLIITLMLLQWNKTQGSIASRSTQAVHQCVSYTDSVLQCWARKYKTYFLLWQLAAKRENNFLLKAI